MKYNKSSFCPSAFYWEIRKSKNSFRADNQVTDQIFMSITPLNEKTECDPLAFIKNASRFI